MPLARVVPILRSFSREAAVEFYVDYLGFSLDWEHRFAPGMPLYMQVSRDGVALHISEHHGDATPGSAVRLEMTGLRGFHAELAAKRYKFARPGLEEQEWGWLEVIVADPSGNRIVFCERTGQAA
jgi:catechol 2,3-dioxygenase-like lactoylglutathione lyase family enzyme